MHWKGVLLAGTSDPRVRVCGFRPEVREESQPGDLGVGIEDGEDQI